MNSHGLLGGRGGGKAGETLGKTVGILQLQLGLGGEDSQVVEILRLWEGAPLQDKQRSKLQGVTLEALAEASLMGGFSQNPAFPRAGRPRQLQLGFLGW